MLSQFMLSLAKPDQYYQVFLSQGLSDSSSLQYMPPYMSNAAIGVGLGLGLLFVPVVNIPMHHFLKRRLIANGVATTGTSVGGVIWPIMLNKLFNNPSVGFAWGVRYSSFILVGLLVVANFLMKTRLPNRRQREAAGIIMPKPSLKALLSDAPYLLTVAG
jgi:MCP family monocarboxylic acid transporter-like MFS transporter 10